MRQLLLLGTFLIDLTGCSTQSFSIRSLPAETPAADNAAALLTGAALAAAASAAQPAGEQRRADTTPAVTPADAPSMYTYDPWERLNRFTYRFNARFDEQVFLPVANAYGRIPAPLRTGVHNFFDNLSEVKTTVNYVLQLRLAGGVHSLGRFVVNSTLGIGGLFNVASKLNLESRPTGFSATLSKWNVHPGPYVVIPLLGPSTLRDGLGLLGDFGIEYAVDLAHLYRGTRTWGLGVVDSVDIRANTNFRYYATGSPFEYETVRFLYVRKTLIEDEALQADGRPKKSSADAPAGK